ncbi:MAG: ABC transporter [Bacteroidetes bacterium]|nr:MAG: ABC transporter [Bacteroidota bacterium]
MLELKNISKKYKQFSLKEINLRVENGDYFVLLGNSGSGKSLLLELIAGLIQPKEGEIYLNGDNLTKKPIQKRQIGLVFQDFALFPHKTVQENILYALNVSGEGNAEKKAKLNDIAVRMNIQHLLNRMPGTLSGGESQRVALARTLVKKPKVLLLDEPLSSLDVQLRSGLRALLKEINKKGQTIIHVTHDYDEAIALGKKVAVIDDGKIIQSGTIQSVFKNPESEFVANFVGMKNFFKSILYQNKERTFAKVNGETEICLLSDDEEGEGYVMIRDEDILIYDKRPESSAMNNFEGIVKEAIPARLGMEVAIQASLLFFVLITHESYERMELEQGKKVWISFKASAVRFLKT